MKLYTTRLISICASD